MPKQWASEISIFPKCSPWGCLLTSELCLGLLKIIHIIKQLLLKLLVEVCHSKVCSWTKNGRHVNKVWRETSVCCCQASIRKLISFSNQAQVTSSHFRIARTLALILPYLSRKYFMTVTTSSPTILFSISSTYTGDTFHEYFKYIFQTRQSGLGRGIKEENA